MAAGDRIPKRNPPRFQLTVFQGKYMPTFEIYGHPPSGHSCKIKLLFALTVAKLDIAQWPSIKAWLTHLRALKGLQQTGNLLV